MFYRSTNVNNIQWIWSKMANNETKVFAKFWKNSLISYYYFFYLFAVQKRKWKLNARMYHKSNGKWWTQFFRFNVWLYILVKRDGGLYRMRPLVLLSANRSHHGYDINVCVVCVCVYVSIQQLLFIAFCALFFLITSQETLAIYKLHVEKKNNGNHIGSHFNAAWFLMLRFESMGYK